jgi:hypothetical protein
MCAGQSGGRDQNANKSRSVRASGDRSGNQLVIGH